MDGGCEFTAPCHDSPQFHSDASDSGTAGLTRYRKRLIGDGTSERNRLQKILEDANIKLSNVLGTSLQFPGN